MSKLIKFDYYKVNARQYNQEKDVMDDGICDLSELLTEIQSIPIRDRVYKVGNDQARLQDIRSNNNKWEMHFVRIRKNGFPIKTNDDGTYGFFDDLGDDEGFGEEVSVIYDSDNHVIMIRRNMHSLSPSGIANYFSEFVNNPEFIIYFKPLIHPHAAELLHRDHLIKSASISVADIRHASPTTKRSLGQIISGADEMHESIGVSLKISIQPKGSKKDSRLPIYEDLLIMATDPNVSKLEIRKKEDEDSKVEIIDLINHRLHCNYDFPGEDISPTSRNILHSTIVNRMTALYELDLQNINSTYL